MYASVMYASISASLFVFTLKTFSSIVDFLLDDCVSVRLKPFLRKLRQQSLLILLRYAFISCTEPFAFGDSRLLI